MEVPVSQFVNTPPKSSLGTVSLFSRYTDMKVDEMRADRSLVTVSSHIVADELADHEYDESRALSDDYFERREAVGPSGGEGT